MRPQSILNSACLFAAASSAWPSFLRAPAEAVKREIAPLLAERQDDGGATKSKFNLSFSATEGDSEPTATSDGNSDATTTGDSSSSPTPTDDNNNSSGDNSATTGSNTSNGSTAKETGSGKTTGTAKSSNGGSKTTKAGQTKSFDPRLPAGGVSMITPNAMSAASYYKIKDWVTFAWNYTSLEVAPSYVDVLATCSKNQATYTVAANQSWSQEQTVLWDTGAYQASATIPLLTEKYTLIIHDAQRDVSATAGSGYLGTWNQFTFGMYSPQPYTPISDYVCATCSGAMTRMEKQTWGFVFAMAGVTIMTFGWFTGVAGIW